MFSLRLESSLGQVQYDNHKKMSAIFREINKDLRHEKLSSHHQPWKHHLENYH